jgi:hypothetical protein
LFAFPRYAEPRYLIPRGPRQAQTAGDALDLALGHKPETARFLAEARKSLAHPLWKSHLEARKLLAEAETLIDVPAK